MKRLPLSHGHWRSLYDLFTGEIEIGIKVLNKIGVSSVAGRELSPGAAARSW